MLPELVWLEEVEDINPDPDPVPDVDADNEDVDADEELDNVDGEEGAAEGGTDVVVEVVEEVVGFEGKVVVVVVEVDGFEEIEFDEVVLVEEDEGFEEDEVDDPVLIKLDELDLFAVHDLVPVRRTNPSLHTHPRWSEVTREFSGHLRQFF